MMLINKKMCEHKWSELIKEKEYKGKTYHPGSDWNNARHIHYYRVKLTQKCLNCNEIRLVSDSEEQEIETHNY